MALGDLGHGLTARKWHELLITPLLSFLDRPGVGVVESSARLAEPRHRLDI